jgi:aminopeptidase
MIEPAQPQPDDTRGHNQNEDPDMNSSLPRPDSTPSVRAEDFSPAIAERIDRLSEIALHPSLWQDEAQTVLALLQSPTPTLDATFDLLHRTQRIVQVIETGQENNQEFKDQLALVVAPTFGEFTSPPVSDELQTALADKLYNVTPRNGDYAVVDLGNTARTVGRIIGERLVQDQIPFDLKFYDPNFERLLMSYLDNSGIETLAQLYVDTCAPANKRILARASTPEEDIVELDATKSSHFGEAAAPVSQRLKNGDLFYTLTLIPTRKDAEIDELDYQEMLDIFFEMCDQPWQYISEAHEELIAEFDAAKEVRIVNDDGTDLTMSIEGFTFCNSLIAKNVPGSEIFSAPERESVNGTLVAKGRFVSDHAPTKIIEDLMLVFEDGEVIAFSAEKGADTFQEFLDRDPGNRFVGELGIGTNPRLKQHLLNGLLVEKIGGSFHLALGESYSYTEYGGKQVHVNNGNTSKDHWDITTMLHGKEGAILLDGRAVMEDGKFIDPKYDVLNRGWAAVPVEERPEHWR